MKYLLSAIAALALASCATEHGTATPGYWQPGEPRDGVSQFGVLIVPELPTPEVEVVPTK